MKEIKLTQGKVAIVDDEDYERLNQYRWCAACFNTWATDDRKSFYAVRNRRAADGDGACLISLHRVIMGLAGEDESEVDHIDGNTLNNVRNNLRVCSSADNSLNRRKQTGPGGVKTSSRFKGVSWYSSAGKWCAEVVHRGRRHFLGCFDDEREAALAYDAKAKELHGQFARTNF